MKSLNIDENLKELSDEEAAAVIGGESLWYWVAYSAGSMAKDAVSYYEFWRDNPAGAATVTSYVVINKL